MVSEIIGKVLARPDPEAFQDLIKAAKFEQLSDEDIAELAIGLAQSGQQIIIPQLGDLYDVPSTGGPSSLSTLLCPLFLRLAGKSVIKLAVPGRPAGGIDSLAQIKGYNVSPSQDQIERWVRDSGYVHLVANKNFTPLDAQLFNYRKEKNAIATPPLVIASLLAKKIAVGVNNMGLDIRVSSFGNFGRTMQEAKENGKRFMRVARLLNIDCKCFFTTGQNPQQPYLGRGEALLALHKVFTGSADSYLKKHLAQCYTIVSSISNNSWITDVSANVLKGEFERNITTQGGTFSSFYSIVERVANSHTNTIYAPSSGIISIDLEGLRRIIVSAQSQGNGIYPDNAGVILKAFGNEFINKGAPICTYRYSSTDRLKFEHELVSCFAIEHSISDNFKQVFNGEI